MSEQPISGVMPRWHRNVHRFGFGLMCALFALFGFMQVRFLPLSGNDRAARGAALIGVWLLAIATIGFGMQLWFWRRMVAEFSYSGQALRFRSLGRPEMQTRVLSEIADIRTWRGRGYPLGYRLRFRDGEKIYLQNSVSNCEAVVEQIRRDLHSAR